MTVLYPDYAGWAALPALDAGKAPYLHSVRGWGIDERDS